MNTAIIFHYFPELNNAQIQQFEALGDLYTDWNSKINLISRKDIDHLYEHHILHSLAIAKLIHFKPGTQILDVGTGGGFPGIPLAIMFPDSGFLLLDSIGKKLKAAAAVAEAIHLENVSFRHCRIEEEKDKFDFVVSRAVMPFPDLVRYCRKNISGKQINALPNGIICLKGGSLESEMHPFIKKAEQIALSTYFKEEFFETKKIIYMPL